MIPELESKQIIVTGAAGFIGSALIARLNELGYEDIIACDRLGFDERWKNLVGLRFRDFVHADDLFDCEEAWQSSATVFHLGACSSTTELDADFLLRNNYEFTKELCKHTLRGGGRFVYASSAATYGGGENGMSDQLEDLGALKPMNMYGYSKQLFDLYAKREGIADQIVGLKYFNVFGPNEGHKDSMRSVVSKSFEQISEEGRISLFKSHRSDFGDGEQMRDFVYVKDAVEMSIFLAATPSANGLFNLGSGVASTWNALAGAIFLAMGRPLKIDYVDMPKAIRDKYQYYTCADISKIRAAGYRNEMTTLEDAVDDYIRNYLVSDRLLGAPRLEV
jgi:ADP-L-glycero-D-manno-heptose 6-epimerase